MEKSEKRLSKMREIWNVNSNNIVTTCVHWMVQTWVEYSHLYIWYFVHWYRFSGFKWIAYSVFRFIISMTSHSFGVMSHTKCFWLVYLNVCWTHCRSLKKFSTQNSNWRNIKCRIESWPSNFWLYWNWLDWEWEWNLDRKWNKISFSTQSIVFLRILRNRFKWIN